MSGGTNDDTFTFSNAATVTSINGGAGGVNAINLAAYTTAVNVTLTASSANGYTGTTAGATNPITTGFSNITNFTSAVALYSNSLTLTNTGTTVTLTGATAGNGYTGTSNDGTATLTFTNFDVIAAGSATDTLIATDTVNTWNVTANNAGTLNTTTDILTFSGFENLTGGSNTDTFVFSNTFGVSGNVVGGGNTDTINLAAYVAAVSVNLQAGTSTAVGGTFSSIETFAGGAASTDTLTGANAPNTWNITANNAGNINSTTTFSSFENLTGGTSTDSFVFTNAVSLTGDIIGGGNTDTIDLSAYTTALTFNVTGANTGNIGGTPDPMGGTFAGISTLLGGTNNDNFVLSDAATLAGSINGNGGTDTLSLAAYTTAISVNLQAATATGIGTTFSSIETFVGGGAASTETLTGANAPNTWNITANNAGNINSTTTFSSF